MDRQSQWENLLNEANEYPDSLQYTFEKLENKIHKENYKKWRLTGLSVAAVFLFFILLVNTSTVFAKGIYGIPVLGTLAEFVNFNKSLVSAIENEYVQEVNITATNDGVTLKLPYIIADERNIVAFFHIPEKIKLKKGDWVNITCQNIIDKKTGKVIKGYSAGSASVSAESAKQYDRLIYIDYHFSETSIPESMELNVIFTITHMDNQSQSKGVNVNNTTFDDEIENNTSNTEENLGAFTFPVVIDTAAFATPKTYEVHQEQIVQGQKLTIEEVTIYPTGTEIYVTFADQNTALVKGIDLEIIDSDKNVLKSANLLSGSTDPQGRWMKLFIESNYFNAPKEQYLSIKGIRLINKDEEYITVDLNKKTITPVIAGMKLSEVTNIGSKANLTFEIQSKDAFGVFDCEYEDSAGRIYNINREGLGTTNNSNLVQCFITTEYPDDGIIILKRSLSPMIELTSPIVIPLNH